VSAPEPVDVVGDWGGTVEKAGNERVAGPVGRADFAIPAVKEDLRHVQRIRHKHLK